MKLIISTLILTNCCPVCFYTSVVLRLLLVRPNLVLSLHFPSLIAGVLNSTHISKISINNFQVIQTPPSFQHSLQCTSSESNQPLESTFLLYHFNLQVQPLPTYIIYQSQTSTFSATHSPLWNSPFSSILFKLILTKIFVFALTVVLTPPTPT